MGSDANIKVLPVHVANKIAAGEVVERPASVAKELLENAIDASATRIDVDIVEGGRKLVAVSDNGSGMSRNDALLSIERHATSKIREVDDIEKIFTLGFRGEALAAIASVSRVRLKTCAAGEVIGTEILLAGGKIQEVRDTGGPQGTVAEVRDLFFNVPARRKFLRSHQTEFSHIRTGFIVQALAHSGVGMSLKVDGREVYRLGPGQRLEDRLCDLFGPDYVKNLRQMNHENGKVKVSGYASTPAVSRSDRSEQYVFVNGRATGAALLSYAIKEGYRTLLPGDKHPSVFLFIETDPALVDVNVHPTKKEVRFREPGTVRDTVIGAIARALGSESAGRSGSPVYAAGPESKAWADAQLRIEDLPSTRAFKYPSIEQRAAMRTLSGGGAAGRDLAETGEGVPVEHDAPWDWCRVVGQVGSLYVVLETNDGLVLMDPHAAHERVLFERFMAEVLAGKVQTQSLLMPETVEMRPADGLRVRENLDLFRKMGFGISEFGGDSFVVDALPSHLASASAESLLLDAAVGLEQAGARGGQGRWREECVAQSACKSAVKARDKLTLEGIEKLVVDLAHCELPYTCPHGRPTLIFTSFKELNRKFGRT